MKKPLLIEGPPGTGKTSLAYALANLFSINLLRIQCFEGITVEQVIGEFNYTKQLLQLQNQNTSNDLNDLFTKEYFIKRPLLQAITSEKPIILLIDEIDRADEEFEAFLLEALGELQVTIPELGTIRGTNNQIIILTSNGTRTLSGALRRRSLYMYIDYPEKSREVEIIRKHVPNLPDEMIEQIYQITSKLRLNSKIMQPPSISEVIDLAEAVTFLGEDLLSSENYEKVLGILLKTKTDLFEGLKLLNLKT